MRDGDESWIRIILRKEETKRSIANMEPKTVLDGRSTKTEGSGILLRFHGFTIELDNGMVVDTWGTVFHIMTYAP